MEFKSPNAIKKNPWPGIPGAKKAVQLMTGTAMLWMEPK
jgi:hypothetical protein